MNEILIKLIDRNSEIDEEDLINLIEELIDQSSSTILPSLNLINTYKKYFSYFEIINKNFKKEFNNQDFIENLNKNFNKIYSIDWLKSSNNLYYYFREKIKSDVVIFNNIDIKHYYLYNKFFQENRGLDIKESLNEFKKDLTAVFFEYFALNYFMYFKIRINIMNRQELTGELEKFRESPELIISVILAILSSGILNTLIKKYLPDKEVIYQEKMKLLINLKKFKDWIMRKSPVKCIENQIQYLDKKIIKFSKEKTFQESLKNYARIEIESKGIDEIIEKLNQKLKSLYEIKAKLQYELKICKENIRDRQYNFKENIYYELEIIFPELKENLYRNKDLLKKYDNAISSTEE